ncbi:hypothetical protein ACAG12_26165, partial [Escherichia coli]|uniref:hypothetical protein n=1 Tax=Escherichia coli TaxID=562 RepID=UPI003FCEBCDC
AMWLRSRHICSPSLLRTGKGVVLKISIELSREEILKGELIKFLQEFYDTEMGFEEGDNFFEFKEYTWGLDNMEVGKVYPEIMDFYIANYLMSKG